MQRKPPSLALGFVLTSLLVACSSDDGSGSSQHASGGAGGAAGSGGSAGFDAAVGGAAGSASGGAAGSASGGAAGSGGSAGAKTCLEQLDAAGVKYTTTVAKGVVDAVHVTDGMFNGVLFAQDDTDKPIGDPIACEFVLHLLKYADVLKAHSIHKIGTLGSYCYRCCCAWSPTNYCRGPNDPEPDCTQNGYSNHSWGRALDTEYFYEDSGEVYDINDPTHWVEYTGSGSTCGPGLAAQTGISKELYGLVCELSADHVFGTILTPNYNSAHRNHIHADIGQTGEPTSFQVYASFTSVDDGAGDE